MKNIKNIKKIEDAVIECSEKNKENLRYLGRKLIELGVDTGMISDSICKSLFINMVEHLSNVIDDDLDFQRVFIFELNTLIDLKDKVLEKRKQMRTTN